MDARPLPLIVSAIVFLVIPGWIWLHAEDAPRVLDADLHVERLDLAVGENGYDALEAASTALDWPEAEDAALDRLHLGEGDLAVRAPDIVARNRKALTLAGRALHAPSFQVPAVLGLEDELPDLAAWTRLVKLMCIEARLLAREDGADDPEAGLARMLEAVALGHRLETARGGVLVHAMVGLSARGAALEALQRLVRESEPGSAASLAAAEQLGSLRSDPEAWRRVWSAEYQALRHTLELSLTQALEEGRSSVSILDGPVRSLGWMPEAYLVQPKRTMNRFASSYRELAEGSALPCNELPPEPERGEGSPFWSAFRRIAKPNAVGDILFEVATPGFGRHAHARCRRDVQVAAVRATLALRAFEREHGALPETLDALVPGYLSSVPVDAFDGRPLRYVSASRLVYSVGDDGEDRGGAPGHAPEDRSEPTFPIGP